MKRETFIEAVEPCDAEIVGNIYENSDLLAGAWGRYCNRVSMRGNAETYEC